MMPPRHPLRHYGGSHGKFAGGLSTRVVPLQQPVGESMSGRRILGQRRQEGQQLGVSVGHGESRQRGGISVRARGFNPFIDMYSFVGRNRVFL